MTALNFPLKVKMFPALTAEAPAVIPSLRSFSEAAPPEAIRGMLKFLVTFSIVFRSNPL